MQTLDRISPRIKEVGLKAYLDETASLHNGFNYDDFVKMVGNDPAKPIVDKANLSRAFKVSRGAIYRWLAVLIQENKKNV